MKSKYVALTSKYIALVPASQFTGETNANPNPTPNPKDTQLTPRECLQDRIMRDITLVGFINPRECLGGWYEGNVFARQGNVYARHYRQAQTQNAGSYLVSVKKLSPRNGGIIRAKLARPGHFVQKQTVIFEENPKWQIYKGKFFSNWTPVT